MWPFKRADHRCENTRLTLGDAAYIAQRIQANPHYSMCNILSLEPYRHTDENRARPAVEQHWRLNVNIALAEPVGRVEKSIETWGQVKGLYPGSTEDVN